MNTEWSKEQLEEMFGDNVIEQLAFLSGCMKHSYYDPKHPDLDGYIVNHEKLAKFSELLIKETMKVVADKLPSNTYLDVADAVIEHFGDEEVEDCPRCGSPWGGTSCGIPDCGWVTGVEE